MSYPSKQLLCVTGLPRAGSTLLCQLLSHHPAIHSPGHSSPLLQALNHLRHGLSDNSFLLAQLDTDFDQVYARLENAFRGFFQGWFAETDRPVVVDKNRGWLGQLELATQMAPDCRMLVCVRDLGQIYGSIEARHRKTLLLDFPDHLAHLSSYDRADKLFAKDGVIGSPLAALRSVQDYSAEQQQRLYYVVFEHLMQEPIKVLADIHHWLGLESVAFDPNQLNSYPHESDSHYRFKYPHRTHTAILPPRQHEIPARIVADIRKNYEWYFNTFYPAR